MGKRLRLVVVDGLGGGIGCFGLFLLGNDPEQFPRPRQVVGASSIGEQAVVANAVEAMGQDMDKEAADELRCAQGHDLVAGSALLPVILPSEADALVIA